MALRYQIEIVESEKGFPLIFKVMRLDLIGADGEERWTLVDSAAELAAAERIMEADLPTSRSRLVSIHNREGRRIGWGPGYGTLAGNPNE